MILLFLITYLQFNYVQIIDIHIHISVLEEWVQELEKKLDKEIQHNQDLVKRVVGLLKEEAMKKEEASRSKMETTEDMVNQWSKGGQGCSMDVQIWRK
jgi:predicted Holliday junction resolvase-like endonuclease